MWSGVFRTCFSLSIAMVAVWLAGDPGRAALPDDLGPLVIRYCCDCHSSADQAGGIDLERFLSDDSFATDPSPWWLAADQLRAHAMPPADAVQPTRDEAETLRSTIRRELLMAAAPVAGDPGSVVLRRLSNYEYTASLRDLTGLADLTPADELPVDGAAGEGFTNVGQALPTSPELIGKYLNAAKRVAALAVLTPTGLRFSRSPNRADWTTEILDRIRLLYARVTEPIGATRVTLQGVEIASSAGGRLPLARYLKAAIEEREALLAGSITAEAVAMRHGLSPRFFTLVVQALSDTSPCLPLEDVRTAWRTCEPDEAASLAARIECWQRVLWSFNSVGHIGKRDGPAAWQTPISPLVERQEIRLQLPNHPDGETIPIWFSATPLGRSPGVVVFESPSLQTSASPSLAIAELAGGFKQSADQVGTAFMPDGSLSVAPSTVMRIDLPAALVAGAELVTTATITGTKAAAAGPDPVQAMVRLEPPLDEGGQSSHLPVAGSLLVSGPSARAACEAQFNAFREVFPAAVCYSQIVPVDEVVTLTLFHREDEPLVRLVLADREREELDQLWRELHFVSGDAIQLVDAYEQLWQYATQDADPSAFEPLRQPILDRAEAHRADLLSAEPVQLAAVIEFAGRAWRRPLSGAEEGGLRQHYDRLRRQGSSHDSAVRTLIARVLVAPAFLYHIEPAPAGERPAPVSDFVLAARLASFLWSSVPDSELTTLAREGRLRQPGVLCDQVDRMLADDRATRMARQFGCQWLQVADFESLDEKSESQFPEFAALRASMQGEAERFFLDFFREDRPIDHLLDADSTFIDAALASFYGIDHVPPAGEWRRLDGMKARGRGGILGLAAVLAKQSGASRTSPILRGAWLCETILGRKLPKPPPGIPVLPDEPPAGLTERQLTELHASLPACASCHRSIDPYGFLLEGFDAIGRHRSEDAAGLPIDARATLPTGPGETTVVEGLSGLRHLLLHDHRTEFVRQFSRKLLGYALARSVQLSDEPLLEALGENADAGASRMLKLIVGSPQFQGIRGRDMIDAVGGANRR
jgi:hypothetical protein